MPHPWRCRAVALPRLWHGRTGTAGVTGRGPRGLVAFPHAEAFAGNTRILLFAALFSSKRSHFSAEHAVFGRLPGQVDPLSSNRWQH